MTREIGFRGPPGAASLSGRPAEIAVTTTMASKTRKAQEIAEIPPAGDTRACLAAVERGDTTKLMKLVGSGCPGDVCLAVVERGDLEMLQQLHARVERFPWSAALCTAAAHRGHLAVLQWLRAHGCEWDSGTADAAAANGRLATLQWALATDCPHDLDHLWLVAAEGGHVDVVEWLLPTASSAASASARSASVAAQVGGAAPDLGSLLTALDAHGRTAL